MTDILKEKTRQFFPYEDINVAQNYPVVTVSLIAANIAIFIYSLYDFRQIIFTYGFIAASASLATAFTSMFLHGGFAHIIGNMWYLWLFGDNVEDKFGKIKYIALYFISGLVALSAQYLTDPASQVPTVGASGAISGILGAYLVLFPRVEVKTIGPFYQIFRLKAKYLIALWFLLQLTFGTLSLFGGLGSNIAFFAHIGGFITGVFAGIAYKASSSAR